jgi:pimeloyl-ACP methyl ester carboxylesterase
MGAPAERTGRLDRGDGVELAWARLPGRGPMVVFLPGYASDMSATKATALAAGCAARGQALLRFDYSGHGQSGGRFIDGTIGRWLADALTVVNAQATGRLLLVGSSMGGWIALLLALARAERIAGLIGIAAAPDFTETLIWQGLPFEDRDQLMRGGTIERPNPYGPPQLLTRALIEDGRRWLLLNRRIALHCPVRLLHGQRDQEVPWETPLRLAEQIDGEDVRACLIKDGDHRLSRPADIALLWRTVLEFGLEDGA